MSFPFEIKDRLVAQGVGTYNTNIFIGSAAIIPTGGGPYLVIRETGGSGPNLTQNDTATENPTAHISVRATNPTSSRAMAQNAYNALGGRNGLYNITLTGIAYVFVRARQVVTDIGEDEAGRTMFSFNIDAEKYPS